MLISEWITAETFYFHGPLSDGIRYRKSLDKGHILKDQKKNREVEVKKVTTYYVKREFKGAITVDLAVKKIISTHMNRSDD